MKYELFEVGGKVRDELLGLTSKDVDYSVVLSELEGVVDPFETFKFMITTKGFTIFEANRRCLTVRARFPEDSDNKGLVADFVIARREVYYSPDSREPVVEYGSLEDDLRRRDFTVNAIAKDSKGRLIDPFNGQRDLVYDILRTPGDSAESFSNDPLRVVRALRFSVTHGMFWSDEIIATLSNFNPSRMDIIPVERIRDEFHKMFTVNTLLSLQLLDSLATLNYPLYKSLFKDGKLYLQPTIDGKK